MNILAHRGFWENAQDKNTLKSLFLALDLGFGIETDIRDYNGKLVISHDVANATSPCLESFLKYFSKRRSENFLALNIKSDGLAKQLADLLKEYTISNYFCFDMSIPETLNYLSVGLNIATRISEYETENFLTLKGQAIWLDGFHELKLDTDKLSNWLIDGKKVCVVSSELHGREPLKLWQGISTLPLKISQHPNFMLCTDHPSRLKEIYL